MNFVIIMLECVHWYVLRHGCLRNEKLHTASVWVKIIIAKHTTSRKHQNHCNNHPVLDSSVFAYLNPNGDFFFVHLNEFTYPKCQSF